jgi:hypothetical protein
MVMVFVFFVGSVLTCGGDGNNSNILPKEPEKLEYSAKKLPVALIAHKYEGTVATATTTGTSLITYDLKTPNELPASLTLHSDGRITGIVNLADVNVGDHKFTVIASAKDLREEADWTLTVDRATYLLFVTDPHYYMKESIFQPPIEPREHMAGYTHDSIFDEWMEQLKTRNGIPYIDYFAALGDYGSTDVHRIGLTGSMRSAADGQAVYWTDSAGIFMEIVDKYVDDGFILNDPIFIVGNHEWGTSGSGNIGAHLTSASPHWHITSRIRVNVEEVLRTDDFIFIASGPASSTQEFTTARINALNGLLTAAPKDRPVFVLAHHPIHFAPPTPPLPPTDVSFYPNGRGTTRAADMLTMLNGFPNAVFMWGHNHSLASPIFPFKSKIYRPGARIPTIRAESDAYMVHYLSESDPDSDASAGREINFTYLSPGAMVDFGYRPNGADVEAKGMVVKILNDNYTFKFFGWNRETDESDILPHRTITFTKADLITGNDND